MTAGTPLMVPVWLSTPLWVGRLGRQVGENAVLMAHDHGIDTGHLGQIQDGVFHGGRVGGTVHAAVQQGHDHIGALGAQLGHIFAGSLHRALGIDLAFKIALVPVHDARRGEADHADLDGQLDFLAIAALGHHGALQHGIGLNQRLLGLAAVYVGQYGRIAVARAFLAGIYAIHIQASAQHLVEKGQTVVEFVIAQRARVKAQRAHGLVHGQLLRAGYGLYLGLVVSQSRALDGVAVVHQQRVGKFLASRTDQRGRALEAIGLVFGQLEIVIAAHIEVQIRGLQNGQRRRGRLGGYRRCAVVVACW